MANILILKRRIGAAQNVSKTTKAMQMIAASKLKKAQKAAVASRPYVDKLTKLTQNITFGLENFKHPYIEQASLSGKTLLIALSPDKGLCGGLITNLIREFLNFRKEEKQAEYIIVGKKIEAQIARFENEIIASFVFGTTTPNFETVYPIIKLIDEYYLSQKVDSVKILYSSFTSVFTQAPKIVSLLPIVIEKETGDVPFRLFEPNPNKMLPSLLKHYLEMTLYQYLLESFVSEQASRMIAMQNATNNANDIIEDLKLEYNKSRQAKITSEILDITGSANANRYE